MARKQHTPEQIIGKLRAIEVHIKAGMTAEQAQPIEPMNDRAAVLEK